MTSTVSQSQGSTFDSSVNRRSSIRATKRKLDDAFQTLDNSVIRPASDFSDRPPSSRRMNAPRSFYSTLAKHGVKSTSSKTPSINDGVLANITRRTPHLTAIITRAASYTRKASHVRSSTPQQAPAPPLPPTAEYHPSSLSSLLSRLATYSLATYANKPPSIDAVAAAKCGWINDGRDRLVCALCNASWVVAGRAGLSRDAGSALIEKQRVSLVEAHKNGCPWRARQCDPSIYCIPLRSPRAMVKEIKTNAVALNLVMQHVIIEHPLKQTQLDSLRSTIICYEMPGIEQIHDAASSELVQSRTEMSDAAILTSVFGWVLLPPTTGTATCRRTSYSTSTSIAPTSTSTPVLSRASSVSLSQMPSPNSSPSTIPCRLPSTTLDAGNTLLQCRLCQRRVGLWTFSRQIAIKGEAQSASQTSSSPPLPGVSPQRPRRQATQRPFDVLKEHRSYCPYVMRSTELPTPPVAHPEDTFPRQKSLNHQLASSSLPPRLNATPDGLEGWRAVLTIVLRHGMAQKRRMEYSLLRTENEIAQNGEDVPMEVDEVKAMVAGVKSRGGRDLLQYVKQLLG